MLTHLFIDIDLSDLFQREHDRLFDGMPRLKKHFYGKIKNKKRLFKRNRRIHDEDVRLIGFEDFAKHKRETTP